MADRGTLVQLTNLAWDTLQESLEGLTQEMAWATLQLQPDQYLHTEGSILSQIAHIANGKIIYASVGFRDTEIRWRELSPKIDSIWPNLDAVVAWLHEAHAYAISSWAEVEDLDALRSRFDGSMIPGWKIIATLIHHDHYHAGQIHMQRTLVTPASTPPPPEGALWESYCKDFPCW